MQSRVAVPKIEPLSHPDGDGEELKRSRQVEAQIIEALSLQRAYLQQRVAIQDFRQSGFIKEECLVYLIRKLRKDGEFALADEFVHHLALRIAKRVHRQLSKSLHESLVIECYSDVISEVTCRIIDVNSDRDDYAQVRFGRWLKMLTFNVMRSFRRLQDRSRASDAPDDDPEVPSDGSQVPVDSKPLPDALLLKKEGLALLNQLDPAKRTAFVLRHAAGWEIVAISKHLGRSTKTISKWLKEAQKELQEMQRGAP
jgi:RNA polymerase sigma factor (sigma-70 family)